MSFIDAHCHLSQLTPEELQAVLTRGRLAGVQTFMAIGAGYGFQDNEKTLKIAQTHHDVYAALAMHPHDAKDASDEVLQKLKNWIANEPKVKAVGEVGLDFHYLNSPADEQRSTLRNFIHMAKELKKPLVIHDRDCGDECVETLSREGAKDCGGMVHCFSGTKELAQKYLDLGFVVSFTGIITFKKADDLRDVVKYVPLDRMTIETDAPFLAPVPHRGKTNEPAFVTHVAECIATLKGLTLEDVAKQTTHNAKQLFQIQ